MAEATDGKETDEIVEREDEILELAISTTCRTAATLLALADIKSEL